MVGDNAVEYGDREDQHKDRQIQDSDQAVSCQAALNHSGNGQAVTRDLSASQKQLVIDVVEPNMTTKKGEQISAYPRMGADKVSMIKEEKSSMVYKDSTNKLRKEWSIEGTL